MRVPENSENWTGWHVDRAIEIAKRLFDKYEAKIDFNSPIDEQERLYHPYLAAREQAVQLASYTHYRKAEAEMLP